MGLVQKMSLIFEPCPFFSLVARASTETERERERNERAMREKFSSSCSYPADFTIGVRQLYRFFYVCRPDVKEKNSGNPNEKI